MPPERPLRRASPGSSPAGPARPRSFRIAATDIHESERQIKYLVTSALPYANGPIHFGHIAGAYLPADVFVRFCRMKGRDVLYVCGTDEHGVAITFSAQKAGVDIADYVQGWHEVIRKTFEHVDIKFDHFSRTTTPLHRELTQHFFTALLEKGLISPRTDTQPFCVTCDRFLPDRYLVGICPYCGAQGARGDECPRCGKWLDPKTLGDIRCKVCSRPPDQRETRHWHLRLDLLQPGLEEWHAGNTFWKHNVRSFVGNLLDEGLRERPITRDLSWGIPVPLPEAKGKVIYVWFDAPIGYISATKELSELRGKPDLWKDYWLDPECRLIHFIGKDNIPFHAVLFPAMLMAIDEGYVIPYNVPANEFYNLEGGKFSTSEGRTIDLDDFFSRYSTDALRHMLVSTAPETGDTEFTWRGFQTANNAELADTLGNLATRVLKFVEKYEDGRIPPLPSTLHPTDRELLEAAAGCPARMAEHIDAYRLRKAQEEFLLLARLGNRYIDDTRPWATRKSDPDRCRITLAVGARLLRTLAVVMAPFLPASSRRLWKMIGLEGSPEEQPWDTAGTVPLPEPLRIGKIEALYEKIDDETIETEILKLKERVRMSEQSPGTAPTDASEHAPDEANLPPLKDPVTIDDFARLDLRVGRVIAAEPLEGSDKLLLLRIDIGLEERQVVSGIRANYDPAQLIGSQVILFANLEPRKIRGTLSQGMVLAADHEGIPTLLTPNRSAVAGSIVR